MKEERNNDVYNHPQTEDEINKQVELQPTQSGDNEQQVAANSNPRANENIKHTTNENSTRQAGSEITDGEDG